MALVSYSESEGSEDDRPQAQANNQTAGSTTACETSFTIDKGNPKKIRVNLKEIEEGGVSHGGKPEPAFKRARIGEGRFTGFNAMLPEPTRDAQSAGGTKSDTSSGVRKVANLRTGPEPGFSRESDAELRRSFAGQGGIPTPKDQDSANGFGVKIATANESLPLQSDASETKMLERKIPWFKPLSVARNTQRKKEPPKRVSAAGALPIVKANDHSNLRPATDIAVKPSLFSIGTRDEPKIPAVEHMEVTGQRYDLSTAENDLDTPQELPDTEAPAAMSPELDQPHRSENQSLDSIATDLKLSASARRQLLGRNLKKPSEIRSSSVINFNTDQEYAANEVLRASGEQVQHNPVRAIAPGKHSLKQLMNAASGQKEALEESFAAGRRNKMEAGAKYGW